MQLDYSTVLTQDPVPYLLDRVPPHIRYHLYTDVFERHEQSSSLQDVKEQAQSTDEFQRMVNQQKDDGLWPARKQFRQEKQQAGIQFFSQVIALHYLLYLGATKEHPAVQKGIVALMKMQREDGKFLLFYQHQGYALWVLMQYHMQGNPHVDRGLRWLLRRQRDDGGWLHTVQIPAKQSRENHPSCIWTTCHAIWPMVHHNVYAKNEQVTKGIDYLLDNFLQPNYTNFFHPAESWDYLYIGHDESGCFRGGTLKVLEIAAAAGYTRTNKTIKKALNWLKDQQLGNGLFPALAGKDTQGDYMVTLRVLNVIKKFYPDDVVSE